MRHVFKTLVKFASAVAEIGWRAAFAQADAQTKRALKLDRVNNNRKGRGRRSFIAEHRRIEAKHNAHVARAKAERWHPPLMDPAGNGAGLYLTPKAAARAMKRAERLSRREGIGPDAMPQWMRANAQQAIAQFQTGTKSRS